LLDELSDDEGAEVGDGVLVGVGVSSCANTFKLHTEIKRKQSDKRTE
jgi:hypothetical protein